jgi:hypothetical protein
MLYQLTDALQTRRVQKCIDLLRPLQAMKRVGCRDIGTGDENLVVSPEDVDCAMTPMIDTPKFMLRVTSGPGEFDSWIM